MTRHSDNIVASVQPSISTAVMKKHIFVVAFSEFYFQLNSQNTKPPIPVDTKGL
jgi:hypothetical protein